MSEAYGTTPEKAWVLEKIKWKKDDEDVIVIDITDAPGGWREDEKEAEEEYREWLDEREKEYLEKLE